MPGRTKRRKKREGIIGRCALWPDVMQSEKSTFALSQPLRWRDIFEDILRHRRELVLGHVAAVLAVLAAVPVPLILPLLVDEVLLHQPGFLSALLRMYFLRPGTVPCFTSALPLP